MITGGASEGRGAIAKVFVPEKKARGWAVKTDGRPGRKSEGGEDSGGDAPSRGAMPKARNLSWSDGISPGVTEFLLFFPNWIYMPCSSRYNGKKELVFVLES